MMETIRKFTDSLAALAESHTHRVEHHEPKDCIYCECLVDVAATLTSLYIRARRKEGVKVAVDNDLPLQVVVVSCSRPRTTDVGP